MARCATNAYDNNGYLTLDFTCDAAACIVDGDCPLVCCSFPPLLQLILQLSGCVTKLHLHLHQCPPVLGPRLHTTFSSKSKADNLHTPQCSCHV